MKVGFSHLQVQGYRRLQDLDLPLRSLNVLIGANGVGKTSVLEVMSLLAASASGHLQDTISEGGGLPSLLTHDRKEPLCMQLAMPMEMAAPIDYKLCLSISGLDFQISVEQMAQKHDAAASRPFMHIDSQGSDIRYYNMDTRHLVRPNWEHQPRETSLYQVPKMFREPERFRRTLASSTLYHVLDVSPRAPVRLPQSMRPAELPGKDAEDLVSCLYFLRETDRDRFEAIEDTLHVAFPTFERMDFPPVAAGSLTLAWKDRNFTRPIYPHQLSEGTLRFLWLATLLQSPGLPTVTLIDEPEVSLHPEMLRLLAELMREAATTRTQLIVATHSDRFVRFLETDELVACDLGPTGNTIVTRASELDIEEWLNDYSLDQLWSMGRLGARS